MGRRAHIVHGFNVTDGGQRTTDRLMPYIKKAGISILDHDYGYFGLLQVRFCNGGIAEAIKSIARKGDIGIGHSNGCAILAEAARRGAPFKGLVLIHPALDDDYLIAPQVEFVHVYHSEKDQAVWFAKLLRFNHPWGAMGRVGYTGSDSRYKNYNDDEPHSGTFENISKWGPLIMRNVQRALDKRKAA
jgi:hypothetical protein